MLKIRSLLVLSIVSVLGFTLAGPTAVANDDFGAPPKVASAQSSPRAQAEKTLAEVQAIVTGDAVARQGHTSDGRDLTLALRDLKLQMADLSPADRAAAQRFFLRPGNGTDPYIPAALPFSSCTTDICIHWTETGTDAPDGSDGNGATVPPFVLATLNTIQAVNGDYVTAGYRTPRRDGSVGGDTNKIDIYIGDIGDDGLYGFCTTDDPKSDQHTPATWDVWAYCALDDDYAPSQFGTLNTPTENMQVTAAHEFFHAVQYAYDFGEDGWIIESTATWAEDEMFDDVDDNRQYLSDSPFTNPLRSIDQFGGLFHYGVWIWWRYLTEKFPSATGKLPTLVREVWERLDGASGGADEYSTQALVKVLSNHGTSFKKEFQNFTAVNRHPGSYYEEGNAYQASKPALKITWKTSTKPQLITGKLSHMAAAPVQITPKNIPGGRKLKLVFDLPGRSTGTGAVVIVYKKGGGVSTSTVALNNTGGGNKTVPFASGATAKVDVILINSSTRFRNCSKHADTVATPFSCAGESRDDNLKIKVTAKVVR